MEKLPLSSLIAVNAAVHSLWDCPGQRPPAGPGQYAPDPAEATDALRATGRSSIGR